MGIAQSMGRPGYPGDRQAEPSTLGGALRRALAGYRRLMDQELAVAGFTDWRFPEGRVLRMCSGAAELTISDVGRRLGITWQCASKIVAGLRQRGYLEVSPSSADGREKILALTPRAAEFLAAQRAAAQAIEARLRDDIGAEAFEQLSGLLDAVAGAGGAGTASDLVWDSPALRALRWRDAHDRGN